MCTFIWIGENLCNLCAKTNMKSIELHPFTAWAEDEAKIPYMTNLAMEMTHLWYFLHNSAITFAVFDRVTFNTNPRSPIALPHSTRVHGMVAGRD